MNEHDELTYAIIGAAIAVHSELGPGLLEHIYENAMCVELESRRIRFEKQKRMTVTYQGEIVGELYADLVVENKVIVELKSVKDSRGYPQSPTNNISQGRKNQDRPPNQF